MISRVPKTVSFSGESLFEMKKRGISDGVLKILRERAEERLSEPRLAVTERMMRAVSQNPHDYSSIGTYWWPNPDTADGLPYVRRDGEATPASLDTVTYRRMTNAVFELSLAAFYFEDKRYAEKAERMLYDWHLNPETYMTPNAEYSQAIPGICNGRGIGIIDFSMSAHEVFDSVAILESLGFIKEETVSGLKKWYSDFADWCLISENGIEESLEPNNHGTYYDVCLLSAAIFTGREALAKKICETAYKQRVVDQIEPDGKQPLELARTMAMTYSVSNLKAIILLCTIAAARGYKNYVENDPRYGDIAVKKAVDFLYPYALNMDSFPYSEFHPELTGERLKAHLLWLSELLGSREYAERAENLFGEEIFRMAYPFI